MLAPEQRHLLTDALRPPTGYSVDAAIATTYTLDLYSLLLAPLAMAAYDHTGGDEVADAATPVAMLESIRRHAARTVVLCQAAGMHVPPSYPRLAAFAEGMVTEVVPPEGGTFHPKVWILRFVDDSGTHLHRFACLSRNLTGDRSWDTLLVCDENQSATATLDATPVATFIEELLTEAVRPLSADREDLVRDICRTFSAARLELPDGFTSGFAVPLGTPSGSSWPLPAEADAWGVVSPFLERSALDRLPRASGRQFVLSRPDTFERVGRDACGGAETRVFQVMADAADIDELLEDEDRDPEAAVSLTGPPTRGLHAKLFCWEDGAGAHVLTGSANCTGAAFGRNIEMSILLSGDKKSCGIDVLFGDDKRGLMSLTEPYVIQETEGQADPTYDVERRIEAWHCALAAALPRLVVEGANGDFHVALELQLPADKHGLAPRTKVRPAGLAHAAPRQITANAAWQGLALHALTPYLVVTTSLESEGVEVERACVILCEVDGAPADRHRQLLRELLASQADVIRYLSLLLGDLGAQDLLDQLLTAEKGDEKDPSGHPFGRGFDDLVLLEPLVRAAARDDDALLRAHRLIEDLRDDNGELPALDDDFLRLWQVVWEARA